MLNFLGDVGGLLSILVPIGGVLIAILDFYFDRTLDSYIIKKVFPKMSKHKKSKQNGSVSMPNQQNKSTVTNKES